MAMRALMVANRVAVGVPVTGSNSGSSIFTVEKPEGVAAGTLLLACIVVSPNRTTTAPAGWSLLAQEKGFAIYSRTLDGSEGSSFNWSSGSSTPWGGIILPVSSGKLGTIGAIGSLGTGTVTAPSITVVNNSLVFGFFAGLGENPGFGTPSGFTAVASQPSQYTQAAFSKRYDAGATGAVNATGWSNGFSRGLLVSVKPT